MNSALYVHIVESLAPDEILLDFAPGKVLAEFLKLSGIPYQYNNVVDSDRFQRALNDRVIEGIRFHDATPILHLAMHGSETGIQLTNQRDAGGLILWAELSSMLLPIHKGLNDNLAICMSSCKGIHGLNMANTPDCDSVPYTWLVGFDSDVEWRELALAYAVFYRRYQSGCYGSALIEAVKAASGNHGFMVAEGKIMQANYSKLLMQKQLEDLKNLLGMSQS